MEHGNGNFKSTEGFGNGGAVDVELLHLCMFDNMELVGTRVDDPDRTGLWVSSQAISINTKVFDFAIEARVVANGQRVESGASAVEGEDKGEQLALDGVDASLETVLARMVFVGDDVNVQVLGLDEVSDIVAESLRRTIADMVVLDQS